MKKFLSLFLFLLFLYSCAIGGVTMLTDKKYSAKPDDYNVELIFGNCYRPCTKIAIIDAEGITLEDATRVIRRKAKEIGADAVLIPKIDGYRIIGTAIVWGAWWEK